MFAQALVDYVTSSSQLMPRNVREGRDSSRVVKFLVKAAGEGWRKAIQLKKNNKIAFLKLKVKLADSLTGSLALERLHWDERALLSGGLRLRK